MKIDWYRVYNENCISGMKNYVGDNSIDLIFTDPPYGINGDKLDVHYNRDESNVVEGYIDVPHSEYAEFSNQWIKECERVLRPGGSIYIVSGYSNLHHILNALHSTSLKEINHLIAKYSFGVSTKNKFVSSHYHVLFWAKPDKGTQKRTFNSNWRYADQKDSYHDRLSVQELKREYKPNQIKNKNQLPLDFVTKFILYSSSRGDVVLDCFGGAMTTGIASVKYGRKFIGFELNNHAYKAFVPMLNNVEQESDPVPEEPSPEDLIQREKLRESWKKNRIDKKSKSHDTFDNLFE